MLLRSSSIEADCTINFIDAISNDRVVVLISLSFELYAFIQEMGRQLDGHQKLQAMLYSHTTEIRSSECRKFTEAQVEQLHKIYKLCATAALRSDVRNDVKMDAKRRDDEARRQVLLHAVVHKLFSGLTNPDLVRLSLSYLMQVVRRINETISSMARRDLGRGKIISVPFVSNLGYNLVYIRLACDLSLVERWKMVTAKQAMVLVEGVLLAGLLDWESASVCLLYKYMTICIYLQHLVRLRWEELSPAELRLLHLLLRPESVARAASIFIILLNFPVLFQAEECLLKFMDESDFEFAEYICESMVFLGSSNLQSITGDDTILSLYLQQMLGYFTHFKLALHFQSLSFWLALMRDLMSKPKAVVHSAGDGSAVNNTDTGSGRVENEKRKVLNFVNDDISSEILDVSFLRMLRREKVISGTAPILGTLELWSDDFEGKGDFGQYRSRLLELVKFVASSKPLIAAFKVSDRITAIIKGLFVSQMHAQELAVMESMHLALENIVSSVFDGQNEVGEATSEVHLSLCRIFEGLLQQLLSLNWTEPAFVESLAHYLIAMGPFLKYFPDAVGSVVNKLFELLTSLPFVVKDPATSSARHARLLICTSFIRIAKTADKSILPHMKGIADTMAYLQREGRLLRGEHNLLGEAFLVMASSAGIQQQQEVLAWLLEPLSQQWTQLEWQNNYLSEPLGLVRLCSETQFMWSLFHTVTFFEKALKRSGTRKGGLSLQNSSTESSTYLHPMASHLSWMLPPLLKLLRAIHSIWSPSIAQALPGEIKAAMTMSDVEQFSLLGEGNPKLSKGALTFSDGSQFDTNKEGYSEPNESDIRNWLKGIRDSGYNVLGLSTTIGDPFFKSLDTHSVAVALMENIQSMEFRHIKQLVHSVLIHLVKSCPPDMWETWLDKLLHPLFIHCQQALSYSWSSLMHEGKVKVPDVHGIAAGSDLKVEVMEEKLLRDLTREICSLLSVMGSSGLNMGLPALEPSGHFIHVDMSSLKDLDSFASSSMVGFLLKHKNLALPVLQISLAAFTWTDGEAMTKVSSFCAAVVLLAILTNNVELRVFVAKDLFSAIIQGLALESNAIISADLVGLCREIYMYLCDRDPAPRQILLSLPCVTQQDLLAFEDALTKTSSPKEQKQHMKSLLLLGTGNKLKALAAQKSVNVITNVSGKHSSHISYTYSSYVYFFTY
ncbi:hypothetical protein EZV62_007075 [Acer yangbiense]|uniref:Exportin-5 C-terminal domain-containing protein n=1 Tax=Acer yangbiense TaxID=1000413 RepID=A0A5C7I8Y5_9ROSI|nr:hypothetical protein EZV62_007075 [Acer yangbiense]